MRQHTIPCAWSPQGTAILLAPCAGNDKQRWSYDAATLQIRLRSSSGMCARRVALPGDTGGTEHLLLMECGEADVASADAVYDQVRPHAACDVHPSRLPSQPRHTAMQHAALRLHVHASGPALAPTVRPWNKVGDRKKKEDTSLSDDTHRQDRWGSPRADVRWQSGSFCSGPLELASFEEEDITRDNCLAACAQVCAAPSHTSHASHTFARALTRIHTDHVTYDMVPY